MSIIESTEEYTEVTPSEGRPIRIDHGDALDRYDSWETPVTIVSDGAYGTGLFPDEPEDASDLAEWYEPHVREWSEHATPLTTLWFWNTEEGWANVHSLLEEYGWEYRGCNIWDKGVQHVAGNVNTARMRKFPQVSEVCVHYVKKPDFDVEGDSVTMQDWLRHEWMRSGLTLKEANDACGVASAASRKYLASDDEWYYPPPEAFESLAEYANEHGDDAGKPYFAIDGHVPSADDWRKMRSKFDLEHGLTNVWEHPPVRGDERLTEGSKSQHMNQKPKDLIERVLQASSDGGDIVWAPFGGLCTTAVVSAEIDRECYCAEVVRDYYDLAVDRLTEKA